MQGQKLILHGLLSALIFSLALSLHAENKENNFHGNFLFGYRYVSTSGANFKYREDINLDDGLRLFSFSLQYTPGETLKKLFDRLELNVYNFGGDPYETLGLSIQKYGTYKFQFTRKKSSYFYHDLYETGSGNLYDMHTFNFDRIADSGFLKIWLGKHVDLYLNFDRFTKEGDSVTTLDVSRIEFEFDKPVREDSKIITVGANLHFKQYSFIVEEKILDYENTNSFFLPGYADGGPSAGYPTALFNFVSNQPYNLKTYTHTFKFNASPFSSLLVAGSAQLNTQKMDLSYSEEAEGINYSGNPFAYTFSGEGSFERKINLYDLDATYMLFNRLAIIGAVRYHDFTQEGQMTVNGISKDVTLNYNTLNFEGGLQYQFSPNLALTAGYRNEARNLDGIETVTYEFKTKRNGFFGNLKWDLFRKLKLTFDFQRGDYNDPLTLIGPTVFDRLRATAKFQIHKFNVSSSYSWNKSSSHVEGDLWESTKNQLKLRAGYNGERINLSAGYSLIDVRHNGDRTVAYPPSWSGPGGTFLWEILYKGKSSIIDASLNFGLTENWKIGGYGNYYTNKGFWDITRIMFKSYLEYLFGSGLATQLGYRYVDFKEKGSGYNDYNANIFEISFGYRWK